MRNASDLVVLFQACFFADFHTVLEGNGEEPIYLPGTNGKPHRIVFTHDYFSSALHEVAHWCVAGQERRMMVDYGYWYAPDGRSEEQQKLFEKVEVKPQALEWLFSVACGIRFRVSADNLNSGLGASDEFKAAIALQAQRYCEDLPERPARFVQILSQFYQQGAVLDPQRYQAAML